MDHPLNVAGRLAQGLFWWLGKLEEDRLSRLSCDCGTRLDHNWFDRTLCQEPCGMMHTRCMGCGSAQDQCDSE